MRNKPNPSKLLALILAITVVSSVFVSATVPTPVAPSPQINDGEKAHYKGVIIKRNGDIVTVRTKDNDVIDALLDSSTRVETDTWWWAKKRSATYLIPGMRVEVWGKGNSQGQLVARKFTFDRNDMKMAAAASGAVYSVEAEQALLRARQNQLEDRQTKLEAEHQKLAGQQDELQNSQAQLRNQVGQLAGEHDQFKTDLQRTREEQAMLAARLSQQADYETRDSTKVHFATGKATLTAEGKAALDEIAAKALATEGYLIEVAGFTDSTGSEVRNHDLSRRRAEVVVDYLTAVKQVPIRRLLTPIGFGELQPIADNSTIQGRAENRRTEVKVLVNRTLVKNQ